MSKRVLITPQQFPNKKLTISNPSPTLISTSFPIQKEQSNLHINGNELIEKVTLNSNQNQNFFTSINMNTTTTTTKTKTPTKAKFKEDDVTALINLCTLFGRDVKIIMLHKPFLGGEYSERQLYDKIRALKRSRNISSRPDVELRKKARVALGYPENKALLGECEWAKYCESDQLSGEEDDDHQSQKQKKSKINYKSKSQKEQVLKNKRPIIPSLKQEKKLEQESNLEQQQPEQLSPQNIPNSKRLYPSRSQPTTTTTTTTTTTASSNSKSVTQTPDVKANNIIYTTPKFHTLSSNIDLTPSPQQLQQQQQQQPIQIFKTPANSNDNSSESSTPIESPFLRGDRNVLISQHILSSPIFQVYSNQIQSAMKMSPVVTPSQQKIPPQTNSKSFSFCEYETDKSLIIYTPFVPMSDASIDILLDEGTVKVTIEIPSVFDWIKEDSDMILKESNEIKLEYHHPGKQYGEPRKIKQLPNGRAGIAFIYHKIE